MCNQMVTSKIREYFHVRIVQILILILIGNFPKLLELKFGSVLNKIPVRILLDVLFFLV